MTTEKTTTDDFTNLINLLAVHSEASTRLKALEAETNASYLDLIDEQKPEYAALQKTLTETEKALRELAKRHPEWFSESKTLTTPYGAVHSQKTTTHEVADAATAVARIKAAQARAIAKGNEVLATQLGALIRVEESVNLEACGELAEEQLEKFGIVRIVDESVTVKPASLKLGQAVKAADKRAAKAAKQKEVAA